MDILCLLFLLLFAVLIPWLDVGYGDFPHPSRLFETVGCVETSFVVEQAFARVFEVLQRCFPDYSVACRKYEKNYESRTISSGVKVFYSYLNPRTRSVSKLSVLKNSAGSLVEDDFLKANIFAQYFSCFPRG